MCSLGFISTLAFLVLTVRTRNAAERYAALTRSLDTCAGAAGHAGAMARQDCRVCRAGGAGQREEPDVMRLRSPSVRESTLRKGFWARMLHCEPAATMTQHLGIMWLPALRATTQTCSLCSVCLGALCLHRLIPEGPEAGAIAACSVCLLCRHCSTALHHSKREVCRQYRGACCSACSPGSNSPC